MGVGWDALASHRSACVATWWDANASHPTGWYYGCFETCSLEGVVTLSEIAPYMALLVTVIIWYLTQRANRQHEIFKEKLKRRVELFDGLIPAIADFLSALNNLEKNKSDPESNSKATAAVMVLWDYRIKMLCYGTTEECKLFNKLKDEIENRNPAGVVLANNAFVDLVLINLRKELNIR